MSRSRRTNSQIVERKLKQGRGQGEGRSYKTWIKTHEIPSLGLSHRYYSFTSERIIHLLSNLEYAYSLKLEWSVGVVDFLEQYPLPSAETRAIAATCGIRYPGPKDGSFVMTTDFLVTVAHSYGRVRYARTTKYAKDLEQPRTIELLEIERLYWQKEDVSWSVVTEHSIPWTLVANVDLVRQHRDLDQRPQRLRLTGQQLATITLYLTEFIQHPHKRFREITNISDDIHKIAPGSSLSIVYHLIASRQWIINMNLPLDPGQPLELLAVALHSSRK